MNQLPNPSFTLSVTNRIALDIYRQRETGRPVVALWFNVHPPTDANTSTLVNLTLRGSKFNEPVYADLLTGRVYAISRERWSADADGVSFQQIPLYDSPILIVEKGVLSLDATKAP